MMGKAIILALIQIGGLGIMTFTSFFAVFFKGTQTFREKQILQEWLNDPSLASITAYPEQGRPLYAAGGVYRDYPDLFVPRSAVF